MHQYKVCDQVHVEWPGKVMGDGVIRYAYPDTVTVMIGAVLSAVPVEMVTLLLATHAVIDIPAPEISAEQVSTLVDQINAAADVPSTGEATP